ncbi:MAG: type II toxin-antitoxin system PemK/MazF family toxin [Aestuariivirga sp.]|nr:type II toxin-antitoxin system PemK/MazF family toxin [Aestuariivirga sp.]
MFPEPLAGQVISYAYLWHSEHQRGQEEGLKDRPCAIILVITNENGNEIVTVLPITHTPPSNPDLAVEIPPATKRRLGLDDERSWVVLTEANRFTWPGPDLRPTRRGEAASVLYGELPGSLLVKIRDGFVAALKKHKSIVPRSE